jgi:hypothetical protein
MYISVVLDRVGEGGLAWSRLDRLSKLRGSGTADLVELPQTGGRQVKKLLATAWSVKEENT